MTVLVLLVLLAATLGQEVEKDPCEPNPCGENTRCQAVFIRGNPVISCDCLPNYKYPVGGDSSDGCVEVRKAKVKFRFNKFKKSEKVDDPFNVVRYCETKLSIVF